MATSTTYTLKGTIQTRNQPDAVTGASQTSTVLLIPFLEFSDNSLTPKENDWVVDSDSNTWLVTGIRKDPLEAMYTLSVRKL